MQSNVQISDNTLIHILKFIDLFVSTSSCWFDIFYYFSNANLILRDKQSRDTFTVGTKFFVIIKKDLR